MNKISKQSEFSRVKANEAKMGAYYTDIDHCRYISRFFEFPEEEVCCLEPSIGDGKAVITVTQKDTEKRAHIKIFGVEINETTYEQVSCNNEITACLRADFLNDVLISHHAFSFLFMNPPYGKQEDGKRYELAFLEKIEPYLVKGAAAAVVVPIYVAKQKDFLGKWCGIFQTEHVYRFHEKEFERFQQVVLMGKKRGNEKGTQHEEDTLSDTLQNKETVPILPDNYQGERILVPKSSEANVREFMTRLFHAEEMEQVLKDSPLQNMACEVSKVPAYIIDNLERPPIIPSEGQMYLLAVSGAGQGLVGNEENGDLHLQRGVSKIVTRSEFIEDENGNMREVVVSSPQISFNLIESDGRIRTLQ